PSASMATGWLLVWRRSLGAHDVVHVGCKQLGFARRLRIRLRSLQSFDLSVHAPGCLAQVLNWIARLEPGSPEVLDRAAHVEVVVLDDVHALHAARVGGVVLRVVHWVVRLWRPPAFGSLPRRAILLPPKRRPAAPVAERVWRLRGALPAPIAVRRKSVFGLDVRDRAGHRVRLVDAHGP